MRTKVRNEINTQSITSFPLYRPPYFHLRISIRPFPGNRNWTIIVLRLHLFKYGFVKTQRKFSSICRWGLEYAMLNMISPAEGQDPLLQKRGYPGYDTKLHLMIWLHFWKSWEYWLLPSPLWPGMVVPVRVPSERIIVLFKNYSYLIWTWVKKKNILRNKYTKINMNVHW